MFLDRWINRRAAAYENEILKKYYAEIEGMYAKMRGWRHDYRHHIQTMKVHMANKEYEETAKYLDMLDEDLTSVETVIKTGNRMADAILNSKLSLAAQNEISVRSDVQIPAALSVNELDLCIVIGNLLDNAIDACLLLAPAERLIRIYMEMKGNYLYLVVTNTTAAKKRMDFHTTKGNGHGFGLSRIDTVVKKNGGYIKRASEDGAFSTEILLPQ